jgi:hypothetical protein
MICMFSIFFLFLVYAYGIHAAHAKVNELTGVVIQGTHRNCGLHETCHGLSPDDLQVPSDV